MIGIGIMGAAGFLLEVAAVIGKIEVQKKKEDLFTFGFLGLFATTLVYLAAALTVPGSFRFDPASLPTFTAHALLSVFFFYLLIEGVVRADRSTFGFVRIVTIPLLLLVDLWLGYTITTPQVIGMTIIMLSLLFLFLNHGISTKGLWYVLFASIFAVGTISLYKYNITNYNITNYNSVVAEMLLIHLFLGIIYFGVARYHSGQNPFLALKQKMILGQASAQGVGAFVENFAYLFAPASIIMAAKRAFGIIWSLISGNVYFHEKHFLTKMMGFFLLVIGIILLI